MGDPQQQPSAELNDSAPPARRNVGRAAFAAFVFGMTSLFCLSTALCGPVSQVTPQIALFLISIGAVAFAIPAGIVVLRRGDAAARARARHGFILASVAILFVLIGFALLRGLNQAHSRIERIKCQHNLRALGQAMLLYAQDNKGQFPHRLSQLITHAFVAPQVFLCPATADQPATGPTTEQLLADFAKPRHCSYIYLGAGSSMSSVPKNFVLAYEPLDNHEKEGAHFIFGDASAEWLDASDAQKLIDQLKSGVNPPKR
jgi:hypothetical protein